MYDLAIIGAGIASASALITLKASAFKIALIAPIEFPHFQIGETLSPTASHELKKLNLYHDFLKENHFKAYTKFSCWGRDLLQEQYSWKEQGWYLDRIKFGQFLWKNAQKTQMHHYETKVMTARLEQKIWHITTLNKKQINCKLLMDCSGRSGIITRVYAERERLDRLVCLYTVSVQQSASRVIPTIASVVEATQNGWFYSSLVPGNKLIISYFTDSDLIPKEAVHSWSNFIRNNSIYTAKRIESAEFINNENPKTVDASTIISKIIANDYFLAAGDAAASFDPLSSHGITTALWSAREAAEAVIKVYKSKSKLQDYQQRFSRGIETYLYEKKQIYSMENRFCQFPFWARRIETSS